MKETKITLDNKITWLEDLHAWETKLWQDVETQYEARTKGHITKIGQFQITFEELKQKPKWAFSRSEPCCIHTRNGLYGSLRKP